MDHIDEIIQAKTARYGLEARSLTDEDLMEYESSLRLDPEIDSDLDKWSKQLAATDERNRRYVSSGWIWKRLFNGRRFRMWEIHKLKMEILDMYDMMKSLESTHPSSPGNAIIMQEIDSLESRLERLQSKANF